MLDLTHDDSMDWSATEGQEACLQSQPRIATPQPASMAPAASAVSTASTPPRQLSPIPHDSFDQVDKSLNKASRIPTTDDDAHGTIDHRTVASPARNGVRSHSPGMHCRPRSCAPTSSCGLSSSVASPPPLTPQSLCDSSGGISESLCLTDAISATAMGEVTREVLDEIDRQSARPRVDQESPPFHATSRELEHGIADTHGRDNDEVEPPSNHPKRRLSRFCRASAAYWEDLRNRHSDKDYEQVSTD